MDRKSSTHARNKIFIQKLSGKKPNRRDNFGEIGADGKIVVK
jgi:hypothetical protein